MRPEKFQTKKLAAFIRRHKIATLKQLQGALGDPTRRTVFRKLETMSYLSSYSHRSMYYTLHGIVKFNSEGLWSCQSVWFSKFGSLIETVRVFVERSKAGRSASELREALQVETKQPLAQLVREGHLKREKLQGRFIYFGLPTKQHRSQQLNRRQADQKKPLATVIVTNPDLAEEEAKAMVLIFLSTLDEQQRRLYAGLESLKLGYGGDHYIAELFGVDPHTVARGRQELVEGDYDSERVRGEGGGRPSAKKKRRKS